MASHPRKFIAQPTDEMLQKFPEKVKHLVKKGREQRYVTHQEIISAVPNAEDNVDLLDEIYTMFVDLGIQVIDVKDALIWEKKSRASTLEMPERGIPDGGVGELSDIQMMYDEKAEEERKVTIPKADKDEAENDDGAGDEDVGSEGTEEVFFGENG
jgi:RNA polymerase primary sigma factor